MGFDEKFPMISIVVPVYNSSNFLRQCLDSILEQTFQDFELLCVDDGSTDNSREILQEYGEKDRRIKIFTRKNDGKGAAAARNLGLAHAKGKYIQFLDSDDFFARDMLECMVEKAEKLSLDVVICRADCFDQRYQKVTLPYRSVNLSLAPSVPFFSYLDCANYVFQMANNVVWNKLFRRELIMQNNLTFESIPISDDQYVPCLALVLAERMAIVDKPFIKYRINIGTSQVDSYHKHPTSGYAASYSIVKKMREIGVYETIKRSYLNMEISLMREYFDRMADLETLRFLYEEYRKEVLPMLGAGDLPEGYFYDKRLETWYRLLLNCTLEEILFRSARSYGNKWLTGILRFMVPYGDLVPGSRIVLVGKNIVGRYWYAQLLLSDYCEVVAWVASEDEIPKGLVFDNILLAK